MAKIQYNTVATSATATLPQVSRELETDARLWGYGFSGGLADFWTGLLYASDSIAVDPYQDGYRCGYRTGERGAA